MKITTFFTLGVTISTAMLAVVADAESQADKGQCSKPSVRKEWRRLTRWEKKSYIDALKCLAVTPKTSQNFRLDGHSSAVPYNATGTSYYDDLVYMHMDQSNQIHFNAIFLPWHRYYLWIHEQGLRDLCSYKGPYPYIDWTKDYENLVGSPIFSPDPEVGFGGNGDPAQGNKVVDGAFKKTIFSYPYPHTVRRKFDMTPRDDAGDPTPVNIELTPKYINSVIKGSRGDYVEMNERLARNWPSAHDAIHFFFGGDLFGQCPDAADACPTTGTEWTPNEPLFWMHHTFIDQVWTKWQEKNPRNQYAYGGPLNGILNPSPSLGNATLDTLLLFNNVVPDVKVKEIIKTKNKHLCYTYE